MATQVFNRKRRIDYDNGEEIQVAPEILLRVHCWNMWDTWVALTERTLPRHIYQIKTVAQLREKAGFTHHFAFFYQLALTNRLDHELVKAATWHVTCAADKRNPWEGRKTLRADWEEYRDSLICRFNSKELDEWEGRYRLIQPALFIDGLNKTEATRRALQERADFYLEQVISNAINMRC
jgi:hypothetical protein